MSRSEDDSGSGSGGPGPDELPASDLGTKEYWDSTYQSEIDVSTDQKRKTSDFFLSFLF